MVMELSRYPGNWGEIALQIKESADWRCEECDRPCRRPGDRWLSFANDLLEWGWSREEISKPQRFTLTVAHLDHTPENCDRANLKAMCAPCHLRYDAKHHAKSAAATRERKRVSDGQISLLGMES